MENNSRLLSEQILELRYKPNPKILDYRGTWAEMLSKLMDLKNWRIDDNRIDAFDNSQNENFHAFVSFRNAGVIIRNDSDISVITKNYFPDQANKLLRFLFEQKSFANPVFVERIGIRSRFAESFNGTFEDLLIRYSTRILSLTTEAQKAFNSKLIDIGGPLNFTSKIGMINAMSGPVEKKQLSQIFPYIETPPDVAFFMDLDYWKNPKIEIDGKDILKTVKSFADENWEIHERMQTIISKDS